LSVAAPPRSLTIHELADATFSTIDQVQAVVDFLETERLIRGGKEDRLQFTHDALAALYHDLAALRLAAGMREAVSHRVLYARTAVRSPREAYPHSLFSTIVFIGMVVGIGANVVRAAGNTSGPLNYAIVAPAHLAWALFMYRLAMRFFVRLPGHAAWLWLPLAAVGTSSLVWTMWAPTSWILSMGLTGFALGLSFLLIALRSRLPAVARREFGGVGGSFVFVGLTMVLAGWAFEWVTRNCPDLSNELPAVTLAMSLVFVVMSVASTAKYASDGQVKAWMGHIDRA
jgi:hypothetical protein